MAFDSDTALATINRMELDKAQNFLRRQERYMRMVNREYEGAIGNYGDQVTIPTFGQIEWHDYTRGQDLTRDSLAVTKQNMRIDLARFMNVTSDRIDNFQESPKAREAFSDRAMYALDMDRDRYISKMYTDVANGNLIGSDTSPQSITIQNAYNFAAVLVAKLLKSDVPEDMLGSIYGVAPAWFMTALHLDPRSRGSATYGGNTEAGRAALMSSNDQVAATVSGIQFVHSNNVPVVVSGTNNIYQIIVAHPDAHSYVEQIMDMSWHDPSETYLTGLKGLYVAGQHTFEPKAMAVLKCTDGTGLGI